ncbi:MAG: hypothetical protein A2452_01135 [Candidatus Firestonebacteria bacterium RIFOXYC2_FULL_39_67]|nr:MAG: hypothetical protein A2536_11200 [Candidatus Firestonebacteria bacterium RIFOXYD2_FULL_39_29]OGF54082.1 MAG: hypothetical protein A2452_01135 [Candidatus Firestonebacteria bacterium RIFOXYC2_FULL_39_67]
MKCNFCNGLGYAYEEKYLSPAHYHKKGSHYIFRMKRIVKDECCICHGRKKLILKDWWRNRKACGNYYNELSALGKVFMEKYFKKNNTRYCSYEAKYKEIVNNDGSVTYYELEGIRGKTK